MATGYEFKVVKDLGHEGCRPGEVEMPSEQRPWVVKVTLSIMRAHYLYLVDKNCLNILFLFCMTSSLEASSLFII